MEEYEKMRRIKRDISDLDEDIQCVKMERVLDIVKKPDKRSWITREKQIKEDLDHSAEVTKMMNVQMAKGTKNLDWIEQIAFRMQSDVEMAIREILRYRKRDFDEIENGHQARLAKIEQGFNDRPEVKRMKMLDQKAEEWQKQLIEIDHQLAVEQDGITTVQNEEMQVKATYEVEIAKLEAEIARDEAENQAIEVELGHIVDPLAGTILVQPIAGPSVKHEIEHQSVQMVPEPPIVQNNYPFNQEKIPIEDTPPEYKDFDFDDLELSPPMQMPALSMATSGQNAQGENRLQTATNGQSSHDNLAPRQPLNQNEHSFVRSDRTNRSDMDINEASNNNAEVFVAPLPHTSHAQKRKANATEQESLANDRPPSHERPPSREHSSNREPLPSRERPPHKLQRVSPRQSPQNIIRSNERGRSGNGDRIDSDLTLVKNEPPNPNPPKGVTPREVVSQLYEQHRENERLVTSSSSSDLNQQFNYRPIRPVARRLGQDGHTGGAGGKESCVQPKDDQSPVRLRQSNDDRSYDSFATFDEGHSSKTTSSARAQPKTVSPATDTKHKHGANAKYDQPQQQAAAARVDTLADSWNDGRSQDSLSRDGFSQFDDFDANLNDMSFSSSDGPEPFKLPAPPKPSTAQAKTPSGDATQMGKQAGNKKSAAPKQQPNSARVAPRVDERSHQSRGESTGRRGNNDFANMGPDLSFSSIASMQGDDFNLDDFNMAGDEFGGGFNAAGDSGQPFSNDFGNLGNLDDFLGDNFDNLQ